MSPTLRDILEHSTAALEPPGGSDIIEKIATVRETEEAALEKVEGGRLSLQELLEVLTTLDNCRAVRREVELAQQARVEEARRLVAEQEARVFEIEEAIKSVK